MISIILAVVIIMFICIATVMMVKYVANKNLMCPHCKLEFSKDLFLIGDNALLVCPFCHRWVQVTKSSEKYIAKKLLI